MSHRFTFVALAASLILGLSACGSSAKTATTATTAASTATTAATSTGVCVAKSGSSLAVLADDKKLQLSDNIVPVVKTSVAAAPLTTALNQVSAALSQTALLSLNTAVSVNRETDAAAAAAFVTQYNLGQGLSGGTGSITVAAANFDESQALAAVYAAVLTKAGYTASAKTIGTRDLYEPALEAGQVQVVPEYAATLTTFLATKASSSVTASSDISATMAVLRPLAGTRGLTALDPAAATDQNAFAVTTTTAAAYGLKTLSDLATKCSGGITLGGPAECPTRPFCQPGLEKTYGLKITSFTPYDADGPLTRAALKTGKIILGEVFSSDPDATPA